MKKKVKKYRRKERKLISKRQIKNIVSVFEKSEYIHSLNIDNDNIEVVGMGGNGIVFKYEVNSKKFCIKILYNNRIKRFSNEIDSMKELSGNSGIVPIIHSGLDDKDKLNYFIMPYYESGSYNVDAIYGFKDRIEDMINLAKTIKLIHDKEGIDSHRDIKIDNIFKINNKIILSDFGLVKFENDIENITKTGERLGPWNISPPEFYSMKQRKKMGNSYKISDVYLFAKVVWQVLKKDRFGFFGAYTDDSDNFIDIEEINNMYNNERIFSVEPINKMIINTTSNSIEYRRRFDINYCIKCLEEQMNIINLNNKREASKFEFNDNINNLMFFQSTNQAIINFDDEQATKHIMKILNNNDSNIVIESYKVANRQTIKIDIREFQINNNIITINWNKKSSNSKYEFYGEVNFGLIDNVKKEILIKFNNRSEMFDDSIYKKMSRYGTEIVDERLLGKLKQDDSMKYLLDKDCELLVSFNGKYSNN